MAEEQTPGTASTSAGQLMRRTSCNFDLTGPGIQSDEIRQSDQVANWWLGPRQTTGKFSGELSAGTYAMLFEGVLRQRFTAGTIVSGLSGTTLTVAPSFIVGPGQAALYVPGASLVTSGIRRGDVVRLSGISGAVEVDSGMDFLINSASAGALLLYNSAVQYPSGVSPSTIGVTGAKTFAPISAPQSISYTIEQQYLDIGVSELFVGNYMKSLAINAPASGFATFTAQMTGINMITSSSIVYGSPAQLSSSIPLAANGGVLSISGIIVGNIVAFSFTISVDTNADAQVGSDLLSGILLNTLHVTGQFTALMSATDGFAAGFSDENVYEISLILTDSNNPGADFINIFLPAVKLTSLTPQENSSQVIRTFEFIALQQETDSTADLTTIMVQDSVGPSSLANPGSGWIFGVSAFGTGAF